MPNPKCRFCGKEVKRKEAFLVKKGAKNLYYCNEQEYNNWLLQQKQEEELRNSIYYEIEDIIGVITDNRNWNRIRDMVDFLSQSYSLAQINDYVVSNSSKISNILSKKTFSGESNIVKYCVAVIQNNIKSYQPVEEEHIERESIDVDFYMAPVNYKPTNQRRSMIEIEQLDSDGDGDVG